MALQIWLPLNKDLKNVGLEQNFPNPSYNNLVINNEGPFTKCHKGTAIYHFQNDFLNTNNWSISLWFNKPTAYPTDANAILLCKNTKASNDCQFYFSVRLGTALNIGIGATPSSLQYPSTFEINKWYHAAATYDGETLKLYFNGELVNSKKISYSLVSTLNFGIGGRATNEGGTSVTGHDFLMNDVRIYDNCITDNDVKRIYQQKLFELVPYNGVKNVLFDRSGFMNMPLVNNGAVYMGNSLYFDGGVSTRLRPQNGNVGLGNTGGTLSIWFSMSAAPSGYRILFVDSTSRFALGFYSNNSFIVGCNGSSVSTYSTSSVKFNGTMNNVVISYNTSSVPQFCLINGATAATVSSNNWTEGNGLTIGGRTANNSCNFTGKIYKVGVYKKQFAQDEAVELYNSERGMFLPDDYIQLEYIQSTGTQWIDTNYIPNADSKLIVKFKQEQAQTNSTYYPISCVRSNDGKLLLECFIKQANAWAFSVAGNEHTGTFEDATNMLNVEMSLTKFAINGTTIKTASTVTVNNTARKLFLFAYNKDGNPDNRYMSCNLYSAKIYETSNEIDTLIKNFVPVKRKSDGVFGLYDTVSNTFFTNSGTGSFTGA